MVLKCLSMVGNLLGKPSFLMLTTKLSVSSVVSPRKAHESIEALETRPVQSQQRYGYLLC